MANYKTNFKTLVETVKIPSDDIFLYDEMSNSEVFERYYQHCQGHLNNSCSKYNIQPAFFYFKNHNGINACAKRTKERNFIIKIYSGKINELYKIYYLKDSFWVNNLYLQDEFGNIIEKLKQTLPSLMFKYSTLFTFHHELGHLIQFSYGNESVSIQEHSSKTKPFDINRHVYEMDADLHSAHAICNYIGVDFINNLEPEDQTEKNFTLLFSVGMASVLTSFLLHMHMHKSPFYIQEKEHPHSLIRISYIMDEIIHILDFNAGKKIPTKFRINKKEIVQGSIRLSNLIYKNALQSDIVDNFMDELFEHAFSIQGYINELIEVSKDMPELVYNRFRE